MKEMRPQILTNIVDWSLTDAISSLIRKQIHIQKVNPLTHKIRRPVFKREKRV